MFSRFKEIQMLKNSLRNQKEKEERNRNEEEQCKFYTQLNAASNRTNQRI